MTQTHYDVYRYTGIEISNALKQKRLFEVRQIFPRVRANTYFFFLLNKGELPLIRIRNSDTKKKEKQTDTSFQQRQMSDSHPSARVRVRNICEPVGIFW